MLVDKMRISLILIFIIQIQGQRQVFFENQTINSVDSLPNGLVSFDINGDHENDIIVANKGPNNIDILFNQGNGIFTNKKVYSSGYGTCFLAAADLNGDNQTDLITSNWESHSISVLLNQGNGTFPTQTQYPTGFSSSFVSVGDVNEDTYVDILVTSANTYSILIFLNVGNGIFNSSTNYSTGSTSYYVTTGDLNNDNRSDLVVANYDLNNIGVFIRLSNETFLNQKTYLTGLHPYSLALADLNLDEKIDIIVTNYGSNNVSILFNQGNGTFQSQITYSTDSNPKSVSIGDLNNDSWPDFIVANWGSNNINIFLNKGNGTFVKTRTYSTGLRPRSIIVVDVNNDYKLDLLVSNYASASISLFVSVKYQNEMTTEIDTSTVRLTSQSSKCSSIEINLIPNSNSSNPKRVFRSEDLLIVSIIEFNCNQSLSMKAQWIIRNSTTSNSNRIQLNSTISMTSSEIYIPSQTLAYGIYQFELTVTMINSSRLNASKSTYIQIISSSIFVNSFYLGTSMITSGYSQDLVLDPGLYSIDLDNTVFNATDWIYEYFCCIYGSSLLLPIENSTCLSNRTALKYSNVTRSSLTILGKSLQSNRTYQFQIQITNRRDSSRQASGSVLVKIQDTSPPMIAIGCIILSMCVPRLEYQYLNPTIQVALFSVCLGNCSSLQNITWNIYSDQNNSSQWTLFNQTNNSFFGRNTSNFTSTNQLFLSNPQIQLWKFEVSYSFLSHTSTSSLNFLLNQPPQNGSCSIFPSNGTTSTRFTISCSNWFDKDGITDYSFSIWTNDYSRKIMIAYSMISTIQLLLPTGQVYLIASIRDEFNAITEYNLSSVIVLSDLTTINNLITDLQSSSNQNQNTVGQILISLSQYFNHKNTESMNSAISNGIPAASISVSSLDSQSLSSPIEPINQSALIEFKKQLNFQANVREYLISFVLNLPITTLNSIKLQSSSLAQLTQTTNELTRTTLTIASQRCYQLTMALFSMSTTISYEDAQTSATQLIQCASNVLSGVNGPLQGRTIVLDLDSSSATQFPDDYDTDLESEWSKVSLKGDQNLFYQKQLANQIQNQMNSIISRLTSILNIQLNIGQQSMININTSQVFMSLQIQSIQSLANQQFQQVGKAAIVLPSIFQTNTTLNSTISVRSIIQPLAIAGNSQSSANTNLSRSISFSILDSNGNQLLIQTNQTHPIEIFIPRDPNLILPLMILQNVTSTDSTPHQQLFHLHYVNLSSNLPISIHIEIQPLNTSVTYLFIYKFDQLPQLNSSINQTDGWAIFSPSNLSNESIYTYFLDNQITQNHQSLVFGLRELNTSDYSNLPIANERYNFTSNYQLRVYSSGCYYLDENNQWDGQGLRVGPLTNHQQTQCFSTHLTTFAGGFVVLPEPVNWQYVFANASFSKNKIIYLTIICVSLIYLIVMIYARYKDKKDLEKLGVLPLSNNHPSDRYFYQILVFTGHRKESGTKSEVQFSLAGDHDQTNIRTFANCQRQIFEDGGIDGFLMSVPRCLGPLNYLHIWHNNSGKGSEASWFLKYLIVRDLQTMETSYFIAQRWFAVEKDDGKIERVLPVASEIEKNNLTHLIMKKAHHNISNDHLWFSIFSRSSSNQFSRVQRCTCCFVLFYLSMFLNIMYYDLSNQNKSTDSLRLGSLIISREQIGIGILVEFLALIPSLLLVQIFRRLRLRGQPKKETKLTFSWWFKFIGYGLCLILVGISMFFIIARGIEFGDLKTQQWLTSILTSFFSSILLSQPLKILCLAVFFTFVYRKSHDNDDQQVKEYFPVKSHSIYHSTTQSNRLTESEILYARNERMKEVQMWLLLHELWIDLIFLCLLFLLTYAKQTTHPYLQVQHLENYFDFEDIPTVDDYWTWLEDTFTENLRAQQWYNRDSPRNLSGYLNDKTNRIIGWPIMRQLRVKSSPCSYRKWNSAIEQAFQYQLDNGYVYEFRGRFEDLQKNLSMLHKFQWIDSQTRTVIIQLNLCNPNVQLLTSLMFLTEFLSTDGLQTTIQIDPIDFQVTSTSQSILLILYMILICYFMFIEIRLLFQLKRNYFHQFWFVIELGLIICSWIGVGLYICQSKEYSHIGEFFSQTNGYIYIDLQYLT